MGLRYGDSFLYMNHTEYEKRLMESILKSERINTTAEDFDDVIYEFKHSAIETYLLKILQSPNVILTVPPTPLPSQFDVFAAKDVKNGNKIRVFVDVSHIIFKDEASGKWRCRDCNILCAKMISAMINLAFALKKDALLTSEIRQFSMMMFADMFTHIIDHLHKISLDRSAVARCKMLACKYFAESLAGCSYEDIKFAARKYTGLSDREEGIIDMYVDRMQGGGGRSEDIGPSPFLNINTFIQLVSNVLKLPKLSTDIFVDKWLFIYGPKTVFGLEYWPALASTATEAYCGTFQVNQKTIEKVCGDHFTVLAKSILRTGGHFVG